MWKPGPKYNRLFRAECELLNCSITVLLRGREVNNFVRQEEICLLYCAFSQRPAGVVVCNLYSAKTANYGPYTPADIQCWQRKDEKERNTDLTPWCPYKTENGISKKQLCFKLAAWVFLFLCPVSTSCFSFCIFPHFPPVDKRSNVSLKMDQWFQIRTMEGAGKADIKGRRKKRRNRLKETSHTEHKKGSRQKRPDDKIIPRGNF